MENLLVKMMLLAALLQFGLSVSNIENCHTRECSQKVEKHSRDVLLIDWKPISVFPEEAARFK